MRIVLISPNPPLFVLKGGTKPPALSFIIIKLLAQKQELPTFCGKFPEISAAGLTA
jgi:hypothetical protein